MTGRLTGLDALRGVAALIVVLFHSRTFGSLALFGKGWIAVDFFFALSGYVMARTYEARMAESWRGFMALRLKRFWPLVLLGGMLGLPLLIRQLGLLAIPVTLLNVAFLPYFIKADIFPVNGSYWSLFYELWDNLAHALVFRRFNERQLGAAIVVLTIAMAALGQHYGTISLGTRPETFLAGFARALLPYLVGVLLFRLWRDVPPLRIPSFITLGLLPASVLALGAMPGWAPQLGFVLVVVPLLLAGGLTLEAGKPGEWFGEISFPLYATHLPVLGLCYVAGANQLAAILIAVAIAGAIALVFKRPARTQLAPTVA